MKKNPKDFYKFAKRKSRIRSRIGLFIQKEGRVMTAQECETLADTIIESFTKRNMEDRIIDEGYKSDDRDTNPDVDSAVLESYV